MYPIRSDRVSSVSTFSPELAIRLNLSSILARIAAALSYLEKMFMGSTALLPYLRFFSKSKVLMSSHVVAIFADIFVIPYQSLVPI